MANERNNAIIGQEVKLQVQYFDINGEAVEPDEFPSVRIVDNEGDEISDFSDDDVTKVKDGLYQILYKIPSDSKSGTWTDTWRAEIGGQNLDTVFTFSVVDAETGVEPTSGPGKIKIGDDVNMDFSDSEIEGINLLLKLLKIRLNSSGTKPARDQFGALIRDAYGEIIEEVCNIFSDDALVGFLCMALSEFNSVPFFSTFTFADQLTKNLFANVIIEGAYMVALAAQSLVEAGRDFSISDGGLSYTPPQLGASLQTHYSTWLTSYRERIKFIKNSIRPGPIGFGNYSGLSSNSPAAIRLRHIRSRRII